MRKIIFLSAMMVLCVAFVTAAVEVDFTVKPEVYPWYYYEIEEAGFIPALEVGVSVMPQLDLVGKMGVSFIHYEEEGDDDEDWMIVVPGLGARYTFWENNNIKTYAFGIFSFPISRQNGDLIDYKVRFFDLGFGGACMLNANCALIGEIGVQRFRFDYPLWDETRTYYTSKSIAGIRFYF